MEVDVPESVHRITGVANSLSADVHARQVRYVVSMTIRTACFGLAFFTHGWWRGVFFVGAVVLPYVAVVIANAGREQADPTLAAIPPPRRPELGPGPADPPPEAAPPPADDNVDDDEHDHERT